MIQDIHLSYLPGCAISDCPFHMSVWDIYCDIHGHYTQIERIAF